MLKIKGTALVGLVTLLIALTTSSVHAQSANRGLLSWVPEKIDWGLSAYNGPNGTYYLLALDGTIINQWGTLEDQILWAKPIFDPNGDILALTGVTIIDGYLIPLPYKMAQYDVNGNLFYEWDNFELERSEFAALHHDMVRLENGNTLVICLSIANVPEISPKTLLDDCLIEVDWEGNVVWEWHTFEHFDEFGFTDEQKQMISDFAGDWAHANSVSIIPPNTHSDPAFTPGNIMVSYREINTVVIIDRQTGEIVWTLGPTNSPMIGQHDAHMINADRPGGGNILLFDNGLRAGFPRVSRPFSQVLEIDPVTKQVVWRYNAVMSGRPQWDFFSPIISGAQRLVNGNTMITEGTKGRLFEVTQDGEIVWDFLNPHVDDGSLGPTGRPIQDYSVFRAYRMPLFWGWPDSLTQ